VLLDYELEFFGPMGVASAARKEGGCMHGVLHLVTAKQMEDLDGIERGYIRKTGRAIPYGTGRRQDDDESIVEATVYCRPPPGHEQELFSDSDGVSAPPTERYLDLLIAGATLSGVDETYIDTRLRKQPFRPRKTPDQFLSLPDSPSSDAEYSEIPSSDEEHLYVTLNGKVIRYSFPPRHPFYDLTRDRVQNFGPHQELSLSRHLYDVKYGAPAELEEFSREHTAYLEDWLCDALQGARVLQFVQVVGRYSVQTWAD
jgi:hypothetical protein